jgi:hypothetical protein
MLGTFLHIVKDDSVMGLYRGVGLSTASILKSATITDSYRSPSNAEC